MISAIFQRLKSIGIDHGKVAAICHSYQLKLGNSMLQTSLPTSSISRCTVSVFKSSELSTSAVDGVLLNNFKNNSSDISQGNRSTCSYAAWNNRKEMSLYIPRRNFSSVLLLDNKYSACCCRKRVLTPTEKLHMKSSRCLSLSSFHNLHKIQTMCCSHAAARGDIKPEEKYALDLSDALLTGERWALARAITLVEATHKKGKRQAQVLLRRVLDHLHDVQLKNRGVPPSFRIGLTGPPGAGKSTFIEALGKKLTAEGHRVAVLAVDPSSSITGGSLLGDKTRMTELSRDANAYIRASPSAGTLGGVTRNTNDTILLCEAAGYDIILVETIGVGQSEYVVADMVDMLVLLVPPAGGDELQGLKKGIVERADFILVNKADGELLVPARRMRSEYTSAVKLMYKRSPLWIPKVKQVSAKTGDGLTKAWDTMEEYRGIMVDAGAFTTKRQRQRRVWMWQHIKDRMMLEFKENEELKGEIRLWEEEVMAGRCTSGIAADELLKSFSKLSRNS